MITRLPFKENDLFELVAYHPGQPSYRRKLLAMGLTPGITFRVKRIAPLGDPVEIEVRGYPLILRQREALLMQLRRVIG